MTVIEIVEKYLKENGFDGLHGHDCWCKLPDLMPCDESCALSCTPGYARKCNREKYHCEGDYCFAEMNNTEYCIVDDKPAEEDRYIIKEGK
jgi:hypothetical protein